MLAMTFVIFRFVRLFFKKTPLLFGGVSYSFYLYCSLLEFRVMISSGLYFVYFRENPDIIGAVPPDKGGLEV